MSGMMMPLSRKEVDIDEDSNSGFLPEILILSFCLPFINHLLVIILNFDVLYLAET